MWMNKRDLTFVSVYFLFFFLSFNLFSSAMFALLQGNSSYQFGFDVKDDEYTNYQQRKETREGNVSGQWPNVCHNFAL